MCSIKVNGCHFEYNGIGISVAEGGDMEVSETTFVGNGKAIEVRDAPPLMEQLGLPDEVSAEDFVAVIRAMQQMPAQEREGVLKSSKIWPFIQNAANVAQIVGTFLSIASS
ncbi:hypothetical protein KTE68_21875 [Burkholderia multivorans]|uniref:hypothetical protein n=1 Tax=Burkholderia multivorans TaxID=87883 RepID=UPI001C2187A6|nr:hypothetical protein [Burkholderia multivorans]MBU9502803.1 hypothetical protein [Burkholderia multivorans]